MISREADLLRLQANEDGSVKPDSFLSSIIENYPDDDFFERFDAKTPFKKTDFYRVRAQYMPESGEFEILSREGIKSMNEFYVLIRTGPIGKDQENNVTYLTKEIEAYNKLKSQNKVLAPIGYSIKDGKYFTAFVTRCQALVSIKNFQQINSQQRVLFAHQVVECLKEAHENGVVGFCLKTNNILYNKEMSLSALFGYIGDTELLCNYPQLTLGFNKNVFESSQEDCFPTTGTDVIGIAKRLEQSILSEEFNNWRQNNFDEYLQIQYEECDKKLYLCIEDAKHPELKVSIDDLYEKLDNYFNPTVKNFATKVLRLIKKNIQNLHLDELKTMRLVVLIGNTQAGKSTTINYLRGSRFTYDNQGHIHLIPNPSEQENKAEMGKPGGVSCTELPVVYIDKANDIAYLDTRGFYDVRKQGPEKEIVSSFLIEMAITAANKVKLVVIEKYAKLSAGFADFNLIGDSISKIVKIGDSENPCNVCFLFNQFDVQGDENKKRYLELSQIQKIEKIYQSILDEAQNMFDNTEMMRKFKYTAVLANSIKNHYYGYVDPTSDWSAENILGKFKNDEFDIKKSEIRFDSYSEDRIRFNEQFIPKISSIASIIKVLLEIPDTDSILKIMQEIDIQMEIHRQNLMMLQDENNLDIKVKSISNFYNEDLKKERESHQKAIKRYEHEIEEQKESLKSFEKEKASVFSQNWTCGGVFINSTTVSYKKDVPYQSRLLIPFEDPQIIDDEQFERGSTEYYITFKNNNSRNRLDKFTETLSTCHEKGKSSAGVIIECGNGIAMGAASVIPSMPEATGEIAQLAIAAETIGLGVGAVAYVGGVGVGLIGGLGRALFAAKDQISGTVTLFGFKKDKPEFQREYIALKGEVEKRRNLISNEKQQLAKIDKSQAGELKEKIKVKLDNAISSLDKIQKLKDDRSKLIMFCKKNLGDISLYVEIAERLTVLGDPENNYTSIAEYGREFLDQKESSDSLGLKFDVLDPNAINSQVSAFSENIIQLKRDIEIQESMGIYGLNPFKE